MVITVGVYIYFCRVKVSVMVFNATFNNISAKYVAVSFICRGTGVPGENDRPLANH
jgi:hypothetical protein